MMYELIWNGFNISNILNSLKTKMILNLLKNINEQYPSDELTINLIKMRLESYIDLYYKKLVFSIYDGKLILHEDFVHSFPDEFTNLLEHPNKLLNLYWYDIDDEKLLYILMKYNKY